MNTEQYNECLRQANLAIKRLQAKIERLEIENANLTDDLLETQDQCRQAENKFEDIESVFCDEDGCPIIEPLNSDGLVSWLQVHILEQQARGYKLACDLLKELAENSEENDDPKLLDAIEDLEHKTDFFDAEKQVRLSKDGE